MNILFICTGNTCRSPMAEGILRDLYRKNNIQGTVKSAGTDVYFDGPANENAVQTMRDMGIDIGRHKSQEVNADLIREADLILTMTHSHIDRIVAQYHDAISKIFTLKEYVSLSLKDKGLDEDSLYLPNVEEMDIYDPYGMPIGEYRKTAKEIKKYLEKFVELIK